MTGGSGILVFSDLDGTLLDHTTYSWAPARPALDRLRALGAGLILATSKTAAEVAPLRAELGFPDWPAIVENGGGVLPAGSESVGAASVYPDIRATLRALPGGFRGFGDMTVAEVARITGLAPEAAARAKRRGFSEPGLWTGTAAAREHFLAAAARIGLHARRGGRFLTLSFGGTKADRMRELVRALAPAHSIALGDAPNDVEMLEAADYGVIVANRAAPPLPTLPGEADGRIRRTKNEGPEGWAAAISALLDALSTTREPMRHG